MADQVKVTEEKEIEEGKIFAVIGYLGILFLVPLLAKKENKFAVFHGKQGMVLFIGWVISWILLVIPILGWILDILLWIFICVLALLGIINALSGKYSKLPIAGDIAEKIKL